MYLFILFSSSEGYETFMFWPTLPTSIHTFRRLKIGGERTPLQLRCRKLLLQHFLKKSLWRLTVTLVCVQAHCTEPYLLFQLYLFCPFSLSPFFDHSAGVCLLLQISQPSHCPEMLFFLCSLLAGHLRALCWTAAALDRLHAPLPGTVCPLPGGRRAARVTSGCNNNWSAQFSVFTSRWMRP